MTLRAFQQTLSSMEKVSITEEAIVVVNQLIADNGPLVFHQSGGCCDGSSPMCLLEDELMMNESDVLLGKVAGCNFYMSKDQYQYWKHTHLTVDVVKGRGASFSLEIPLGVRFLIKSRLFTEEEQKQIG